MLPIKHKSLMIQGTASTVGKSIVCTALCRIFTQDGYNVNPFKSQNMSLNSFVTPEGLEMGRAQVMQAEAAGKIPSTRMNPILLKPTSDRKSQVVVNGVVHDSLDAVDYFAFKPQLKAEIHRIHHELQQESDIVVIEGAGSPAEINLNHDDLVNMGMAQMADAPVLLVGDIDKGGVFAALYGTVMLLDEAERSRIKGIIINKFRGSYELLEPGLKMLEAKLGIPVLGVVPYFNLNLEDEDSVTDWTKFGGNRDAVLDVAVIRLPYLANFTDFNVFKLYQDANLRFVGQTEELAKPDLIIIPGSKSTVADLQFLQQSGLADQIKNLNRQGVCVFGICGGYQMLGMAITDPGHTETTVEHMEGLGLLPLVTEFQAHKTTTVTEGVEQLFQTAVHGYEIHMGVTQTCGMTQDFIEIKRQNGQVVKLRDGAMNLEKRVFGTYLHGIFDNSQFTRAFLNRLRVRKGLEPVPVCPVDYRLYKEAQYDRLAQIVREHLNLDQIYAIVAAES